MNDNKELQGIMLVIIQDDPGSKAEELPRSVLTLVPDQVDTDDDINPALP